MAVGSFDRRGGQEGNEIRLHPNRARSRATAAMWCREGLVQVHVDRVKAHVARAADAHEGVQIGPVIVQHRSARVYHFRYIEYLPFE